MNKRATAVGLEFERIIVLGEPILDTHEGVLIIAFDDGTSRTFNWDKVTDYYYLTAEETARFVDED